MIFRLTKGWGPDGLSPFDTSTKPFWRIPKSDLILYAKEHNLEFRSDASNEDINFHRNLIRKNVLPELRKITPNLEQVFVREANTFGLVSDYLFDSVDMDMSKGIMVSDFLNLPVILQYEYLRKLVDYPVSTSELDDALRWLNNNPKGNSRKGLGKIILKVVANQLVKESLF